MTKWIPDLARREGPAYLLIADAIGEDVLEGRLREGDRLPTHRALADALGVTVGTITRAYVEAGRRGLVTGEVGRGTFVRGAQPADISPLFAIRHREETERVDFSLNYAWDGTRAGHFVRTAEAVARDPYIATLLGYQPAAGLPRHRTAAGLWLARGDFDPDPANLVISSGAQNGIVLSMAAVCRPGDTVLMEALTYPGAKAAADLLGLKVKPVAIDEHGILPDALETACRSTKARAVYCVPTFQNPTGGVMPEERRIAIARIALRYGLYVIEDDVYGFLAPDAPDPIAAHVPEYGFYIASASKCMAPALRVGFVVAPPGLVDAVAGAISTSCWMASPICTEIMARWVEDGSAADIVRSQRTESAARFELAREILGPETFSAVNGSYHLWMPLPSNWRVDDFIDEARRRNVFLISSDPFVVGRKASPQTLRLCLGTPERRDDVEFGLRVIADLLRHGPRPRLDVV